MGEDKRLDFRGTIQVGFSVKAKNEDDARLEILFIASEMSIEDILRNIVIQNIDPHSKDCNKFYFKDTEDEDEEN